MTTATCHLYFNNTLTTIKCQYAFKKSFLTTDRCWCTIPLGGVILLKDNLRLIRTREGISQRELGRRINMSGQYIAKIEKGLSTNPTLDTLFKIANALNSEIVELIDYPFSLREQFYSAISKQEISFNQLKQDLNFTDQALDELLNPTSTMYNLDNLFTLGKYLGFSKGYIEKYQLLPFYLLDDDEYGKNKALQRSIEFYNNWKSILPNNTKYLSLIHI